MKKTQLLTLLAVCIFAWGCAGKSITNTVNTADEMKGRTIGVLKDTPAVVYADGYGTLKPYTEGETMLVDLKNGGLDCSVMEENSAKSLLSKVTGLKILSKPLVKADFCFAIAKENPDLTSAVNGALKTLTDNGTLKKIIEGYKKGNYTYVSPDNLDVSAGTLTLAVDGKFSPYSYSDERGQITGLDIDVANAVCDLIHVKLKVITVNRADLITTVQFGKASFAMGGLFRSDDTSKLVDFSNSYSKCTMVIITRH